MANLAEERDVDDAEKAGTDHGYNAEVEPLTSGVLGHLEQTTSSGLLQPLYNLEPGESRLSLFRLFNYTENY